MCVYVRTLFFVPIQSAYVRTLFLSRSRVPMSGPFFFSIQSAYVRTLFLSQSRVPMSGTFFCLDLECLCQDPFLIPIQSAYVRNLFLSRSRVPNAHVRTLFLSRSRVPMSGPFFCPDLECLCQDPFFKLETAAMLTLYIVPDICVRYFHNKVRRIFVACLV